MPQEKIIQQFFFFNLIVSSIIYLILFFSARLISEFFSEPSLIPVLRVLTLIIIINGFNIIPETILVKKVDFKTQAKVSLISNLISGLMAIYLVFSGFGIWSLVLYNLSASFFKSLLLWFYTRWFPLLIFKIKSFKDLFNFGSKLLVSGLIDTISNNITPLLIGRFYTTEDLGYYTNANNIKSLIRSLITSSVQRVTYPVLSSIQDNPSILTMGFKKIIKLTMFFTFPLMLGLAILAEPLFFIVLGEQWLPSVIYFQLLCFVGMLYPLHAINLNILKVAGRSDLFLRLEIYKKLIYALILFLFLFFYFEIVGLIYAAICSSILSYFLNSYYSGKFGGYSMKEQIRDIFPFFFYTLIMVASIMLIEIYFLSAYDYFIRLIIGAILGFFIYIILCKIFSSEDFKIFVLNLKDFYKQALEIKDKLTNKKDGASEC